MICWHGRGKCSSSKNNKEDRGQAMDLGYRIIDLIQAYMAHSNIYFPIAFSFIILGVSASVTFFVRSDTLRIMLIILLAGFFYWISVDGSEFEQEYFLNMSTELLGTIVSLIIFASAMTASGWTFPMVGMIVVVLISILTIKTDDFNNGFSLNMSTELLGAFLTTVLLNRDWLWTKDKDGIGSLLDPLTIWLNQRVQKRHTFDIKTNAQADYFVLVRGVSEAEIMEKVDWLTRSGVMVMSRGDMRYDTFNNCVYQEIGLVVDAYEKQTEAIMLSNQEARVRVLGYRDTAYRIHQQMTEVMECEEPRHASTPNKELTHLEFTTQRPRVLFSDYVATQINLLVREWRNHSDEGLSEAATHLMDWAIKMNFVKGKVND
jgi:hypothetical protein